MPEIHSIEVVTLKDINVDHKKRGRPCKEREYESRHDSAMSITDRGVNIRVSNSIDCPGVC